MKLVKTIILPERLEHLKNALEENGFNGMTITAVDEQRDRKSDHCDGHMPFDLLPRIQIEIVVDYHNLDHLISTIVESCRGDSISSCRIIILPVEKVIRVLNGEISEEFLVAGTFRIEA